MNPLAFARATSLQYLRFQLTTSRIADPRLGAQVKSLIWPTTLDTSPLLRGPYVSINRAFVEGARVDSFVAQGVLHPLLRGIIPYPSIYQHQEDALRAAKAGKDVLVTTGTGSGKTEAFLYPIIDRCLRVRDDPAAPRGVVAVIVYPMNALANDQLKRLRDLLAGSGVTFGMYTGDVKEEAAQLTHEARRLPPSATRADYDRAVEDAKGVENVVVHPPEERVTREEIQAKPPQILLVNSAILEFNLTRGKDLALFFGAPLEFIVVDEAHTYTGARGAEVAMLLRRLQALVKPPQGRITRIATSATIVDKAHDHDGQRFMSRLFGCDAANVVVVRERYQEAAWPAERVRTKTPENPEHVLTEALEALDLEDDAARSRAIEQVFRTLTQTDLPPGRSLPERLDAGLRRIDYARAIEQAGAGIHALDALVRDAHELARRGLPYKGAEAELLAYLALGAYAEKDGVPLLRPKLHYFVKGLDGAAVVLTQPAPGKLEPKLYLSRDEAAHEWENRVHATAIFDIVSCPQCGQHHYEQFLQGVTSEDAKPLSGGMPCEGGTVYVPDHERLGKLVLFTDRILLDADAEEGEEAGTTKHLRGLVCAFCGALHTGAPTRCGGCTRAGTLGEVWILNSVAKVKSCPVCKYSQGWAARRYAHPFRALREVTVANIHILAQDMLNQADAKSQRLIVFADNRQEAAFQAGWTRDRARRFRFRQFLFQHLVPDAPYEAAAAGAKPDISLGHLLAQMRKTLDRDHDLAQLLAPEVYQAVVAEAFSPALGKELDRFLTVQVLREVASAFNTRASLEAWGRLRVRYHGLAPDAPAVQTLAAKYNLKPETACAWLESLLDIHRRRQVLHDPREPIFSRTWERRYDLVRNRYLPAFDFYPEALRLEPDPAMGKVAAVKTFLAPNTATRDWLRALDLREDDRTPFLRDVWRLLTTELGLLVRLPALQYGGSGAAMAGTANVYQIDASKLGVTRQAQRWECKLCGRFHARATPDGACTRYRCRDGEVLPKKEEEPLDYDLAYLDSATTFVLAEEHTAQVPGDQRARIEAAFKDPGGRVNCLVATPTLELGVDIGALDMVLLRNVPPLPANYWQRAGRAGRRNRMAVVYTYARSHPHDLYYFRHPTALLGGAIRAPRFNLRNPVMVRKHVHAAVLTHFHAKMKGVDNPWLASVFPSEIGHVLFQEGRPRATVAEVVRPLRDALADEAERARIVQLVKKAFSLHWPPEAADEVAEERLAAYVREMPDELERTYDRVLARLKWAVQQRSRLHAKGTDQELDAEEKRFLERCDRTVRSLKPYSGGEGDDQQRLQNYTLAVLSREGFLPGHATSTGQIVASADRAYNTFWKPFEFDLPRRAAIAVREHVPGNLIYANGGKYRLAYYKFPATEQTQAPPEYVIDETTQAIRPAGVVQAGYQNPHGTRLQALPLVDSVLSFVNHVDDFEVHRFRMPSAIAGVLQPRHKGGTAYRTGQHEVHHLRGQLLTLVNLGPFGDGGAQERGFPVCTVCGGVRSPFDSDEAYQKFEDTHKKRCGKPPGMFALQVEAEVDGLLFPALADQPDAVNLGEALVLAANHLLEMNRDDLLWVEMPQADGKWQLFVYDPMPGGSGLLQQVIERWTDIVEAARRLMASCVGACPKSCQDCLRTYYNQVHHDILDRHRAIRVLEAHGKKPETLNDIPPAVERLPPKGPDDTNLGEKTLEARLKEWGFLGLTSQVRVELPRINSHTIPDLADPARKVAIYLDGPDHYTEPRKSRDAALRGELEELGWTVHELDVKDADNPAVLDRLRRALGRAYQGSKGTT